MPLKAAKRSPSVGPSFSLSAFSNFSHADRSGKNTCVMQNIVVAVQESRRDIGVQMGRPGVKIESLPRHAAATNRCTAAYRAGVDCSCNRFVIMSPHTVVV